MRRLALIAAAALTMGAARPATVDYRLGLDLQPDGAPPTAGGSADSSASV